MNDAAPHDDEPAVEFEYELDAPPQKVWRALSVPELRESWLPREALADREAVRVTPGQELSYRMQESEPPFLQSTVTFRIAPNGAGGTSLRIIHKLASAPANSNRPAIKLAA